MEGVVQNAKQEDWSSELEAVEAAPFFDAVRERMRLHATSEDEQIGQREFTDLLLDPVFAEILSLYGICLRIEPDHLWEVVDSRCQGTLSVDEVAWSLLRLRGTKEQLHSLLVWDDMNKENRKLLNAVSACERRLCERYEAEVRKMENSVVAELRRLQLAAVGGEEKCTRSESDMEGPSPHSSLDGPHFEDREEPATALAVAREALPEAEAEA